MKRNFGFWEHISLIPDITFQVILSRNILAAQSPKSDHLCVWRLELKRFWSECMKSQSTKFRRKIAGIRRSLMLLLICYRFRLPACHKKAPADWIRAGLWDFLFGSVFTPEPLALPQAGPPARGKANRKRSSVPARGRRSPRKDLHRAHHRCRA